jgi:hypothetical protein
MIHAERKPARHARPDTTKDGRECHRDGLQSGIAGAALNHLLTHPLFREQPPSTIASTTLTAWLSTKKAFLRTFRFIFHPATRSIKNASPFRPTARAPGFA